MIKFRTPKKAMCGIILCLLFHLTSCRASELVTRTYPQNVESVKKANRKYRGVVYDVGLQFNLGSYSVDPFNPELVKHDMSVIASQLHANAVRIEGEEIARLVVAAEAAHQAGLQVFFNPWKMHANAIETVQYMRQAAVAAEKLRKKGIDLVFIAGCEYSLFSQGAFPGETFNERMTFMIKHAFPSHGNKEKSPEMMEASKKLNKILADIIEQVRKHFKGPVTYSSGTWEEVDWNLFDIVGIDYYRRSESEQAYVEGLDKYRTSKPLVVMEVGSCAYEGAAIRGDGGFAILQGINPDGTPKYEGGKTPVRSEKEQADYVETQVKLLTNAGVDAVFIYVFSFPVFPFDEKGLDLDMTSYALVKSYPKHDPRSKQIPSWEKKEAFHRLAEIYEKMADLEK